MSPPENQPVIVFVLTFHLGHYGQTDPHFRHNFVQKTQFSIVQNADIFMCVVKSPTDDILQASLPKLDRNTVPNKHLIHMKKKKRVMWNHTILRFQWHEDSCIPTPTPTLPLTAAAQEETETHAEVLQRVAVLMQAPLSSQHAFPIRSWAKELDKPQACRGSDSDSVRDMAWGEHPGNPCNSIGCN